MVPAMQRAAARRLCATRSVVVGGHGVADVHAEHDPENLCVAPAMFRRQLELLLDAGFELVSLDALAGAGPPPPGRAALTFDDGMENTLSVLAPILREYGVPATVFVVPGLLGRPNPWMAPEAGARMLTADEVVELAGAGVAIGAHTMTHPDLAVADAATCREEVAESRRALEALVGAPVTAFAYPFCRAGGHAVPAVREGGFARAVVGARRGPWDPLRVPRAMVTGVDGVPAFLAKLAGVYEPAFDSAAGHAVRAVSRRPRRLARRLRRASAPDAA